MDFDKIIKNISDFIVTNWWINLVSKSLLLIALGIPSILFLGRKVQSYVARRYNLQRGMIAQKIIVYFGNFAIIALIFSWFGFDLTPILGAAGVVTIAVGFAAQTGLSNIISGVFLIAEESFRVGDIVKIEDIEGFVESIDILSIKLRTFNNHSIRFPNESIIKSKITNITKYPLRRVDLEMSISLKEDLEKVRDLLLKVAKNNPLGLIEPPPLFMIKGFTDSGILIAIGIWGIADNYLDLKTSLIIDILKIFKLEEVELSFPHRIVVNNLSSR
jgi:small-conductance mechanosensitive channel